MRAWQAIVAVCGGITVITWAGCGSNHEALVSVTVMPAAGTATHGFPNETVQFTANGNFGSYGTYRDSTATAICILKAADTTRSLTQVTWTTSDSTNTRIDVHGVATCIGTTALPATITASAWGVCGRVVGTATLSCN